MKHADECNTALLISLCEQAGVEVSDEVAGTLVDYLAAVVEMNRAINLTRIETMEAGVRLHLLDSLIAMPEVRSAATGTLCDLGTGGGFPAVPLALACDRQCIALDSVGKKAAAVNELLHSLQLGGRCTAVAERAEYHARTHPQEYAVVTARALAPLPSIVELAAPLLASGGTLVAFKGAPTVQEVAAGDSVAAMVGMRRVNSRSLVLPGGDERRSIVSYLKVGTPRMELPRREGLAQHAPLA